jgi:hypothetical protein
MFTDDDDGYDDDFDVSVSIGNLMLSTKKAILKMIPNLKDISKT